MNTIEGKTAKEWFDIGYNSAKSPDEKIKAYSNSIKLSPNCAVAYEKRGSIYKSKAQYDLAINDFSKAIELKFDCIEAYNGRGNIYKIKKQYDLAIKDFSSVIELDPDYAEAYFCRGNAYRFKDEYDLAIKDYTKATELKSDYSEAYCHRGNTYKCKKQYDLAIKDYTKAIELKPDYVMAYDNRGICYKHKNEYDKSIRDCSVAIELNPNNPSAYNNRGCAYKLKKQYDTAMKDFNKALELNPRFAYVYVNRANIYKDKEQYNLAIKDFNRAIEIDPDFAIAYNFRAFTHEKLNNWKEAISDYKKILSLGIDSDGKTKVGRLKTDYEKLIKEAEPKAKAQVKAEDERKKLTAEYDAAKLTKRFDKAMLKYLHVHDNSNVLCQIPEWAERIVSNTATADDDWIKTVKVGKNVAVIESNAFKGCPNLEWVDFSEASALRAIEKNAFAKCNRLIRVRLPKDCKLKGSAFPPKCKIEKIDVKPAIQPIFINATPTEEKNFADEYNASKAIKRFDRSVLRYLHLYDECKMLCNVPEWAERIAPNTGAFNDSWIKTVKIGKNVAVIENDAFRSCPNLEWVDFSEAAALKIIEKNAFAECNKLVRVRIPKNCKPKRGAFPKKCKIEKINVKANIQRISADIMPTMPAISSTMIENIGFNSLSESVFGKSSMGNAPKIGSNLNYMQPSILAAPICDTTVIGSNPHYTQSSMVTAPLGDTTVRGGYGDSIL